LRQDNNNEVIHASARLHEEVIPAYGKKFCEPLFNMDFLGEHVCFMCHMHGAGINYRFVGEVRKVVTNELIRTLYLDEMVLRVLKDLLRTKLRQKMAELKIPAEGPYLQEMLSVLNLLTCPSTRPEGKDFWFTTIKTLLIKKFGPDCLSDKEKDASTCLLLGIDKDYIISRLSNYFGILFNPEAINNFQQAIQMKEEFSVLETDIINVIPRIKYQAEIDLYDGMAALYKAQHFAKRGSRTINQKNTQQRLLNVATKQIQLGLSKFSDSKLGSQALAQVFTETGCEEWTDPQKSSHLFDKATFIWAKYHSKWDKSDETWFEFAKSKCYRYGATLSNFKEQEDKRESELQEATLMFRELFKKHPDWINALRQHCADWLADTKIELAIKSTKKLRKGRRRVKQIVATIKAVMDAALNNRDFKLEVKKAKK